MPKGTIAIEEAVIDPAGLEGLKQWSAILAPLTSAPTNFKGPPDVHSARLLDIHKTRIETMDKEGVEYMLLSLTSPGPQGESDPAKALELAQVANNYLSAEVSKNSSRFGALASIPMHSGQDAAAELRRSVKELGFFGAILNDFQSVGEDGQGKEYFDGEKFDPFWAEVQELGVPVYLHPRYMIKNDLLPGTKYGERKHLLGAGVQFHLDLSWHIYAICSSGVLDRFPGVQLVCGHMGEGIPFNLWRATHWINSPLKKPSRPCLQDYKYYFTHNVNITTSGFFSTEALKFCIEQIGADRCLYAIDYPYENIEEGQEWWRNIDLGSKEKELVARENAIRLFKLPLEL